MKSKKKEQIIFDLSRGVNNSKADFDFSVRFIDTKKNVIEGKVLNIVTGTKGRWEFSIKNNHKDYGIGSIIAPIATNYHFGHRLQTEKPKGRDYIKIETTSNARLELKSNYGYAFTSPFTINVVKGVFKKGDEIFVTTTDMTESYWTTTTGKLTLIVEHKDGVDVWDNKPIKINGIAHNKVSYVRILLPTVAKINEEFSATIAVYDRNSNIIEDFKGKITINSKGLNIKNKILDFSKEGEKGVVILKGLKSETEGVYRIYSSDYVSNPVIVKANPKNYIYWGDLHAHGWGDRSMYIMAANTNKTNPYNRHYQAKHQCRLDYTSVGPMAFPRINKREIWEEYQKACKEYNEENIYIPFLSYEAHPKNNEGDRNIIFKDINETVPPDYEMPLIELEEIYKNREDVIPQVHIGGATPKYETYDTDFDKMVEAISAFGNAEWLLQKLLSKGRQLGVCGCTDLHAGLLGGPRAVETGRGRNYKELYQRDCAYGSGPLTAAVCESLTRDNIWNSFTNKSTYAISGARMYIDIELNNSSMGETTIIKDKNTLAIECCCTANIDRIDVICGTDVIRTYRAEGMDIVIEDIIKSKEILGKWLYVRVRQKDEHFGITTPIFIDSGFEQWDEGIYTEDNESKDEADLYKKDLIEYLINNEDRYKFSNIKAIGIVKQENAKCALFSGVYENTKISIRWFYEFEIPKIRIDWKTFDNGVFDDEVKRSYK